MANTSVLYMRIDSDLKENAESILNEVGISPSNAVTVFYKQVVKYRGMPFDLRLPAETSDSASTNGVQSTRRTPVSLDVLTKEQIDEKLERGLESAKNEKCYTKEEVQAELAKRHGI